MQKQPLLFLAFVGVFLAIQFSCKPLVPNHNKIQVYILAGQSNAVGYNNTDTYIPIPFPKFYQDQIKIKFWPGSNAVDSLKDIWTTMKIGASGINNKAFGPEISFAYENVLNNPDKEIAIIKYAVGGTGIANSEYYNDYIPALVNFNDHGNNWHPPAKEQKAGMLYLNLLQNISNALTSLDNQDIEYELAGILWMQGEHEAGLSLKMALDYELLLSNFITSIRKDLGVPNLPIAIGQISNKWIYHEAVQAAQKKVCESDPYSKLIITKDLERTPNDDAHYTANGMILLGEKFAAAFTN